MVKTATSEILALLRKGNRAAFRSRELAALLGNKNYTKIVLHRLKERGEVKMVKRGWWAFPDAMPQEIACQISRPSYVSFFSALNMHGLTTQIPGIVQLAVCRNAKSYEIKGEKVKEYKVKKRDFNNFVLNDGILLATPEKAFADCLNVPKTASKSILVEAIENIDLEKVKPLLSPSGLKRLKKLIKHA